MRALTLFAVLLGLAMPLSLGARAGDAAGASRASIVFLYQGSMSGQEDQYGFVSVSQPYAKYGHLAWMWGWTVRCVHTGALYVGGDFSCSGLVTIYGWARQTYLYGISQDCTATMTNRPGATWRLSGTYLGGTRLRFAASGPLGARVIRPNPIDSNCGPDDAINWLGDIGTVATSDLLNFSHSGAPGGFDAFDRTVSGTYSYGTAHFNSQLFVRVKSLTTVPTGLFDQWGDQIGDWLTQQQDQQANQAIVRDPLNIDVPVNGSLSGQGVPVTGGGGVGAADLPASSQQVFTIGQRLRAGVLTPLQIRLTPLGQSLLASSAPLPKLKITLKFAPSHGRARSVTRVVTPPPPLPAG